MSTQHEKEIASRNATEIGCSNAYFKYRPQIDTNERRNVFEAGFNRALAKQATRIAELEKDAARYLNLEPVAWRYQFFDWENHIGVHPAWSYSGHNCKGDLPAESIIEPLFTQAKEMV